MPIRRLFVAIDISEDVRRAIADHVLRLKEAFPDAPVKWEPTEKFHITMKFFGDTDGPRLKQIEDLVASSALSTEPFKLTVKGPGLFRSREGAVLWIGVGESAGAVGRLTQIANILEGNARGPRRFHPHITIARTKRPAQARELIDVHTGSVLDLSEFLIDHLTIYESNLLPTGSVYSVVSEHLFQ